MGDPRKSKKKYRKPKVKYEAERISEEKKILQKYGLKNKKEIWKAESEIRRIRNEAKRLLTASEQEKGKFLKRLSDKGLIQAKTVDDVLEIKIENVLNRRLQTVVANKFKINPKYARQAIVHGHVMIAKRKVNIPSYIVNLDTEQKVQTHIVKQVKKNA